MSKHSLIGASSMHRWQNCPGSVRLSKGLPPTTNEAAQAGTRAHEWCADILQRKTTIAQAMEDLDLGLDLAAITFYVTTIEFERASATHFHIEQSFQLPNLHEGYFGTADAWGYWEKEKLLRVYDFKYGSGHFVKVENNVQLLYYAFGAAATQRLDIDEVEVSIIQPRCPRGGKKDHRWRFPFSQLIDFGLQFIHAARRTEEPEAPLVEGSWCFFCPAVKFCPAQHQKRNERAKNQFSDWSED